MLYRRNVQLSFAIRNFHNSKDLARRHSRTHYYDVLGITPKATHNEIKSAFYRKSKDHHPDTNPDSEAEKFHEITEAYDVLGNVLTRKKYDRGIYRSHHHDQHHRGEKNEPEMDNSTFRPRNFKGRGPIQTGKTQHYNFDEWYSQHYGASVLHSFKKKQAVKQAEEQKQQILDGNLDDNDEIYKIVEDQRVRSMYPIFILMGLTFIVLYFKYGADVIADLESSSPECKHTNTNKKQVNRDKAP